MVYAEVSRSAESATLALGEAGPRRGLGGRGPRGRAHLLQGLVAGICATFALLALWSASASAKLAHPYLSSFGAFSNVEGVAVDQSTGDVYVYDSGAGAILKYDAAGAPAEFSSTKTNAIAGVPGAGGAEAEIAVDSSTGPAKGDIYLAHGGTEGILVFDEAGEQVGSLTEEAGVPWGETCGVSVDQSGAVYVGIYPSYVNRYVPKANPVTNADYTSSIQGANNPCNVAVDGAGNVFAATYNSGPITRYQPSQFGGLAAIGSVVDFAGSTLAVDPSNDDVYVDQGSQIAQFGASGEPFEEPLSVFAGFGEAGAIASSEGIAVDETTGDVYVSDGRGAINVFGPAGFVPTVHTGGTPDLTAETATVAGEVDPEGVPVEECYFEYWTTAFDHQQKQCTESAGEIGGGHAFVHVHAELSGLSAEVTYHYMLVVSNENGAVAGEVAAFRFVPPVIGEFVPPVIEGGQASDVSASSAELEASVNPKGSVTEYHFEYGPTESYGASTPTLRTGQGASLLAVEAHVQGLTGETVYHYRLVAINAAGTTEGADHTFTTEGDGGPLTLLDGRRWELVSPPEKHGAGIIAQRFEGGVIQAAEDGNGLVYMAQNPIETEPEGNSAPEPTQILARRLPDGGWSNRTMTTPSDDTHALPIGDGTEYRLFSPSLSGAILEPNATEALAPGVTQNTVYLRSELECPEDKTNCYTPLLSSEDTAPGAEYVGAHFVVASKDLEHALIQSEKPLAEGAPEGGLYEWSEGALQLVSIDESGTPVRAEAGGAGSEGNVRGAISNDGSRVFFCKRAEFFGCEFNGPLYMRDTVTQESVRLDPATSTSREFQIATEDGFRVFFTYREASPAWHLDECEVQEVAGKLSCERSEVAPEAVGSVLGIDGSGEIVYFVSKTALAGAAVAGEDNLYVSRLEDGKWVPTFIATLAPEDERDWASSNGGHATIDDMTSRVSPNGRYLAFMSDRSLTGYDNHDAVSGEPDQEVFLYDEQSGKLSCASCNPTGARPEGMPYESGLEQPLVNKQGIWRGDWIAASVPAWDNISLNKAIHQTSYLTDEGRLFFNSSDDLSPQDSNGLVDVYEYEPTGVGSCTTSEGCVQLISSGTSGEESVFLDASANGGDVFFITSSQLTGQDDDTAYDVYDAHVCTSATPCEQPPVSPPPCSNGESCKPGQTPQPTIYGAPASATFSGAGNLTPAVPATRKAKAKIGARQKLRRALSACARMHAPSKRKLRKCRARARRRYGKAARGSGRQKARGSATRARQARDHGDTDDRRGR
jgi:hypothetical protein